MSEPISFFDILKNPIAFDLFQDVREQLIDFCHKVDVTHPELYSMLDGELIGDSAFCKKIVELVKILEFAKKQQIVEIVPTLIKSLRRHNNFKDIFSCYRFYKNPQDRLDARKANTSKPICLSSFFKDKLSVWNELPKNFSLYSRHSDAIYLRVKELKTQIERFQELGCHALKLSVEEKLRNSHGHAIDDCYGFCRITMRTAALILAKQYDFVLDKRDFGDSRLLAQESLVSLCSSKSARFYPVVHPYDVVRNVPEHVCKMISLVEALPEIDSHPLFDNLFVISFGLNVDCNESLELIANGQITPVVLGERDNKCYFICSWRENG